MQAVKAKLRKIGNSIGVIFPKDVIIGFKVGDVITLNVITDDDVITPSMRPDNDLILGKLNRSEALPIKQFTGELTKQQQISQRGFNAGS
jgi:antitoxin component of MazEF toxin-antitoxin module